ncbi:MAG: hypothetical protein HDQ98_04955 [Lachnospiraceae bacterium]|nr:hypothetical protein [Lachnospiraceae bacterium]
MKSIFDRHQKLLFCVACVVTVIVGGIYYFYIQHSFVPNAEDLATTQQWYLVLKHVQSYRHSNIVFDVISCLSVLIGGMSYFSIRLEFTLFYVMVLGLGLYLSASGKKGRKPWFLLPLWAFFMILIHTVQADSNFTTVYDDTDLIRMFPYNYHIIPLIFALISLAVLQCWLNTNEGKKKNIIIGIEVIVVIYASLFTDLIYYIIFLLPMLIVLALRGLYNDKARKYMMPLLALGVGLMLLTRILPVSFFQKLWDNTTLGTSYGAIYGGTDWLNLDNLILHITNYIKAIMLLFNIDLSSRPLISFYSVLFVVRIAFVVIGYVIVAKVIACSVKGKAKQNGFHTIDEILAWGFVILSCSFIFTRNALYRDLIRYYTAFVPILTILLCRYVGDFLMKAMPVLETMKQKKIYFAGMIGALCICQVEPVWNYRVEASYREDCEAAIEYLRQWGAETSGYAVAPYWLYARLSAMTDGEILFYDNAETIKRLYGEDAVIRFMVVGWDDRGLLTYGLNNIAYSSYAEMCENYKSPIRAVELDYIYVCEFGE